VGTIDYRTEWDPAKAASNRTKHKITFEEGALVLMDPLAISIPDNTGQEQRWVTMGRVDERVLIVIHTFEEMDDHIRVRIISARKATKRERRAYEEGT
jgi:uncharacterized protein